MCLFMKGLAAAQTTDIHSFALPSNLETLGTFVYLYGNGMGGLTVVKPVPEAVEPILYQIFRRSKVEPRVDYSSINS